jgi:hypothetical protein
MAAPPYDGLAALIQASGQRCSPILLLTGKPVATPANESPDFR